MSEALVIPLTAELHCFGPLGIDGGIGVRAWEEIFGKQADYIDEVSRRVGYDLWELAETWRAV